MNDYATLISAQVRRIMLEALECDVDYAHNERILQSILETFGHSLSGDRLRTELTWLNEQGLITIDTGDTGAIWVAKLTNRGEDVALGRATVPGVRRHRPGD